MFEFLGLGQKSQLDELDTFLEKFLKPLVADGGRGFRDTEALVGAAFLFGIDKKLSDSGVDEQIKSAMREAANSTRPAGRESSCAEDEKELRQFAKENCKRVPHLHLRKLFDWMKISSYGSELISSYADDVNLRPAELLQRLVKFLNDAKSGEMFVPPTTPARSGIPPSLVPAAAPSDPSPPGKRGRRSALSVAVDSLQFGIW